MMKKLVIALTVLFTVALSSVAWSGSYLDRAALLLDESRKEGDVLEPRTFDKETVLVIKAMAEARVKVGRSMIVPEKVAKAHPHLLLVLENNQRAAEAAADGNFKKVVERLTAAREEEKNFRAILTELGYALPDISKK